MPYCAGCRYFNNASFNFCPKCGKKSTPSQPAQSTQPAQTIQQAVQQPSQPTVPQQTTSYQAPPVQASGPKPRRSVFDYAEEMSKDETEQIKQKTREQEAARQDFYEQELAWKGQPLTYMTDTSYTAAPSSNKPSHNDDSDFYKLESSAQPVEKRASVFDRPSTSSEAPSQPTPQQTFQEPPAQAPKARRSVFDYVEERSKDENDRLRERTKNLHQDKNQSYADELHWRTEESLEEEEKKMEKFQQKEFKSRFEN
eukprot:TRINITY_DN10143_c0_g1_i1.p1 TRINITY_DN10143_c0_g1~~TRINITY_DN10143_c0_g1_i1.p1  ORF type:complete len:255 (-),score=74.09 TRINITY_DN10143_c0_g1_i1:32-796(-)